MNLNDRKNLRFLMNSNMDQLAHWYATASMDDIAYAMELLTKAREEQSAKVLNKFDGVDDLSQAKEVLSKFTLH